MSSFNMKDVLYIIETRSKINKLKPSTYIEKFLQSTYERDEYKVRRQSQFEERRPLVNKALYDLILETKDLPTVNQFKTYYFNIYNQELSSKLADNYIISIAYLSLIRDLHFFYLLKESNKFTDVTIDYLYDLYAQTDILLMKDNKKIGLQLFQGSKQAEASKRKDLENAPYDRNYEIFLFSVNDKRGERLRFNKGHREVVLYGPKDMLVVESMFDMTSATDFNDNIHNIETDKFIFLQPPTKPQQHKVTLTKDDGISLKPQYSLFLVGKSIIQKYAEELKTKFEPKGIEIFEYDISNSVLHKNNLQPQLFVDGVGLTKEWKDFLKANALIAKFNIGQYLIIHSDESIDIHIKAGAGSGKTHTLVSRAIFLLNTNKIKSIDEIAMITFTNEAADNMRIKLAKRFMQLFKKTKNIQYRKHLEDLRKMQIQTIPSFAKSILQQFGHFIGLGSEFRVANLVVDRRKIIQKYLSETSYKQGKYQHYFKQLQHHNLIKFIETVWSKVEQKGILMTDLVQPGKNEFLRQVVYETLQVSEIEFNEMKVENNVLTVADLTRFLQMLLVTNVPLNLLNEDFKYLFVDEFQDTDNAQIEFIGNVAGAAEIPILVVGDIKQSIYRFRGANASAFDELKTLMINKFSRVPYEEALIYNYRTIDILLDQKEAIFNGWRKNGWLPTDEEPMKAWYTAPVGTKKEDVIKIERVEITGKDILEAYNTIPQGEENKVLAILVRTNTQAREIGAILADLKEKKGEEMPPFNVTLEGTLFQSDVAKDLCSLLASWLKPNDPVTLYTFAQTAFCQTNKGEVVIEVNDNKMSVKDFQFRVPKMWLDALELLKFNPVLTVLNEFLGQVHYVENVEEDSRKKYELNLYKILSLMYANIGNQNLDLLTLHDWLAQQINTNYEEDEAELDATDFNRNSIRVMTVHKSKGLEFDTVIIPYVNQKSFNQYEPEIDEKEIDYNELRNYTNVLVQFKKDVYEFGWRFVNSQDRFINITENYSSLKIEEEAESICEETRILYVAMTRAERRLFIYDIGDGKEKKTPKKWSDLLKGNM